MNTIANASRQRPVAAHLPPQSATHALLRERFHLARGSGKRAKEAAESLGLSEGQALAAHTGEHGFGLKVVALRGAWIDILRSLERCGPVMALTRNASTVHEKTGTYRNVHAQGMMGLALGEEIDLRLFFSRWHAGFSVLEHAKEPGVRPSQSLQFFDACGVAVHKIFVRPETDRRAFDALVAEYCDPEKKYVFGPAVAKVAPKPDNDIDALALAQAWAQMKDTHEFFGLISKLGAERQQALRLMEGRFTQRAHANVVRQVLDEASMDGTALMVFVGSPGCIQIHSGRVKQIEPRVTPEAQWINVLDPGFNLHLREDLTESAWIVEKPTADGVVTSIEVFDKTGELMVMFFGARKPGSPEQAAWREIVARLPRLSAPAPSSVSSL